jgi:hypothetical protein
MIIVPTVPHTGTHFVKNLLADTGQELYVRHVYPAEIERLEYLLNQGHPTIVPSREPDAVIASWLRYGKDPENFAGMSLLEWWKLLDGLVMMRQNVYLLHLDNPELRDLELATINFELQLELATDWTPVRETDTVQIH